MGTLRNDGVMSQEAESLWVGSEGGYEWLVAKRSLGDLLSVCPEIVIGKFVAVTAFDSGPVVPTEEERVSGWNSQFGIAYSPKIADVNAIPYDNCYDEWYIFDEPTEIGRAAEQGSNIFEAWQSEETVFQFVNYHLGLHLERHRELADLFWIQIRRIGPDVYLADCQDWMTMVSKSKELFAAVRKGIERPANSG